MTDIKQLCEDIKTQSSDMDCPQLLADLVGVAIDLQKQLTEAIDEAKRAIRNTDCNVIEGLDYVATVKSGPRETVDTKACRELLGDSTPTRVTNVTSVTWTRR